MCGIVGYTGHRKAHSILLDGLRRLEYRGYDSCGVALPGKKTITIEKQLGFVEGLKTKKQHPGLYGIGHTRWATVGRPTIENAHPFTDCSGNIAIVHNGDIDNFISIREKLENEGHQFTSDTDSEIIAHLIESYNNYSLPKSVVMAISELQGSYALAVLSQHTNQLIVARQNSPLVIGIGENEQFVASDVPAFAEKTPNVIFLEDGDIAVLSPEKPDIFHNEIPIKRSIHNIPWVSQELGKAGYRHHFLKEVHEQPRVLQDSISGRISNVSPGVSKHPSLISYNKPDNIFISACGSAYHAALIGKQFWSNFTSATINVEIASEIESLKNVSQNDWGIFISQSGETADTIAAARIARNAGYTTIGLTNTPNSSLTRLVEFSIETKATPPENSVAASKTFISQVMELYLLTLSCSQIPVSQLYSMLNELRSLPEKAQRTLEMNSQFKEIGEWLAKYDNSYLIAKGINYPVALEGALKLKELAYQHAEAFPAGELKHGPFALLTESTPVLAIVPDGLLQSRMLTSIKEIKSRGAPVIAITNGDLSLISPIVDIAVKVPSSDPMFMPIINTIALQLIAYHCADARECPIDRPRNLAKSVTVH
jgi:glucosamine--fructose-6-phosphate aminotransferase (isomerizing)